MKSYAVLCLALSCALLAQADIEDVRNAALKKMEAQFKRIENLAEETPIEVARRESTIKRISKHAKEFADGLLGKSRFEINKNAKSAYMMANFLQSEKDVFRCIEARQTEGIANTEETHNTQFLQPGQDYETKAADYQRQVIEAWKNDYYYYLGAYKDIYKRTVIQIERSPSEAYINTLVIHSEETTVKMADIITGIYNKLAKVHIEVLRNFDQLVAEFQQDSRASVDETAKKIQQCLPKLFQEDNFLTALTL